MSCVHNNSRYSHTICEDKCKNGFCTDYNYDIAIKKRVVEPACDHSISFSEKEFGSRNTLSCKGCKEQSSCSKVLNPEQLLDGNNKKYSEFDGYCAVMPLNYITVDLGEVKDVKHIQFLLWDNRGNDKDEMCSTKYSYRLMISDDKSTDSVSDTPPSRWRVLYDSLRLEFNGWQVFKLNETIKARFVRLHIVEGTNLNEECLSVKIVAMEVYSKDLFGYNYNYLPTFETTINVVQTPVKERKDYVISRFCSYLSSNIGSSIKELREKGTNEIADKLDLLKKELDLVQQEAALYEYKVQSVKEDISKGVDKQMKISNIILISSFIILLSSLFYEFSKII